MNQSWCFIFATFVLSLFLVVPIAAQEQCVLPAAQAPGLLNLKLGNTPEEVQSVFGRDLKIKIKKLGERTFFQNFIKKPAPPTVSGVRALYLRFFDRKLYQTEIFYENRESWQTLADFTDYLSATLALPANAWTNFRGRNELKCLDFKVVADKVLNPRVEITDEQTLAKVEETRAQAAAKQKK